MFMSRWNGSKKLSGMIMRTEWSQLNKNRKTVKEIIRVNICTLNVEDLSDGKFLDVDFFFLY